MIKTNSASDTVDAVERAFRIISLVRRRDGAGVTELSEALDMSKSGVHKHLSTLVEAGYLVNGGGEYRLSFKFLGEAEHVKQNSLLYDIGVSEIDTLAERVDHGVYLVAIENETAYCVYHADGECSAITDVAVGDSVEFHSTAAGKTVAAHCPRVERKLLFSQDLPASTATTITDPERLREELATVREEGVAFDDEEHVRGMRALGKPIFGPDGRVLGSVAVSAPVSLLPDDRFRNELPELLARTTNLIEVKYTLRSREGSDQESHASQEFD